jgi:hypothetical protein
MHVNQFQKFFFLMSLNCISNILWKKIQKFKMAAIQYGPFKVASMFAAPPNCQFSIKSYA